MALPKLAHAFRSRNTPNAHVDRTLRFLRSAAEREPIARFLAPETLEHATSLNAISRDVRIPIGTGGPIDLRVHGVRAPSNQERHCGEESIIHIESAFPITSHVVVINPCSAHPLPYEPSNRGSPSG